MDKICQKCFTDPSCHSFRKISEKNGIHVYYTNPVKSRLYYDTDGILKHYDNALKQVQNKKWSWIFDGEGFDLKHAMEVKTGIGIAKILTEKYADNLVEINVINPTWHIKTMLNVIWPFLSNETKQKIKIRDDRYYSVIEFI